MTETKSTSIYEKSDKTDAILVIDGRKLYVNKAVLSYHSDYFKALFLTEMNTEIEIKDVNYENFAFVLSLVHNVPIEGVSYRIESFMQLADRFQLPAVKRHLELFILSTVKDRFGLIRAAEKYALNETMNHAFSLFREKKHFYNSEITVYGSHMSLRDNSISKETKIRLFYRALEIDEQIVVTPKPVEPLMSICEKAFVKSDKTDAILVIQEKKLHVNKALLCYHSDYFNTLFNSDFKEKSMEEIPIEEVKFENFATLLSMIHLNPITPTKENAENILELADRFMIPCIKFHLEISINFLELDELETIRIGEKYGMSELVTNGINRLKSGKFNNLNTNSTFQAFSDDTKIRMFFQYLRL